MTTFRFLHPYRDLLTAPGFCRKPGGQWQLEKNSNIERGGPVSPQPRSSAQPIERGYVLTTNTKRELLSRKFWERGQVNRREQSLGANIQGGSRFACLWTNSPPPLGPLSSTETEGVSTLFITISLRSGITPDPEQVLGKYL